MVRVFEVLGSIALYLIVIIVLSLGAEVICKLFKREGKENETMTKREMFKNEIITAVEKAGHTATFETVTKNGDVKREGLIIDREESEVSPVVYMDDLYDMHKTGVSVEDLVKGVLDIENPFAGTKAEENLEKFKDNLGYRLLNAKNNRNLLKDTPHKPVCDGELALCLEGHLAADKDGMYVTLINNATFDPNMWDIARATAFSVAPPIMTGLEDALFGDKANVLAEGIAYDRGMYVLTNESTIHGASALFYDGVMERVHSLVGDFYAIPSSIHEWIIVPKSNEDVNAGMLRKLLNDANGSVVDPTEVLSDKIFECDGENLKVAA